MKNFQENVEIRGLDAVSIFFASFLAGLNTYGILNQAVVNKAAERAGEHLARFALLDGPPQDTENKLQAAVDKLRGLLRVSKGMQSFTSGNSGAVSIQATTCRFCPKGVGEAELKGTLCPFPALVKSFYNVYWGTGTLEIHKNPSEPMLKREGDHCIFEYDIK